YRHGAADPAHTCGDRPHARDRFCRTQLPRHTADRGRARRPSDRSHRRARTRRRRPMMKRTAKLVSAMVSAIAAAALLYACTAKIAAPDAEDKPQQVPNAPPPPAAQKAAPATEHLRALGYGFESRGLIAAKRDSTRRPLDLRQQLPPPTSGEELWVIARADDLGAPSPPPEQDAVYPSLRAKPPGAVEEIPLPLTHTDVQASIAGYIASVRVMQQYQNPYDQKIEAVYVFPLPQDAAVNEFVMTIGERRIRGIIRERAEAERTYAEAKQQGYVA